MAITESLLGVGIIGVVLLIGALAGLLIFAAIIVAIVLIVRRNKKKKEAQNDAINE